MATKLGLLDIMRGVTAQSKLPGAPIVKAPILTERQRRRAEFARTGVAPAPRAAAANAMTPQQARLAQLTAAVRSNTGASAPMLAQKLRARRELMAQQSGMRN